MIRSFDWRDLTLLHRLRGGAHCFDAKLAYTRGHSALRLALLTALSPRQSTCTLIASAAASGDRQLVGQFCLRADEHTARMAFIGPPEALTQSNGVGLLEALAKAAGKRGAHHLMAEVDEHHSVLEIFRRAGFAIYGRQSLWRLNSPTQIESQAIGSGWRWEQPADHQAIYGLCQNLVPALLQQVEPSPTGDGQGLVHWRKDELLGYLHLAAGPRGVWVRPYIHPTTEMMDALLTAFVNLHARSSRKPIYVGVHSYQSWINGVLERVGFELVADLVLMVKRLAAAVRRPVLAPLSSLERTSPEPTAPFVRHWNQKPTPRVSRRT
jgi:hypothetical protein